jgi:hypothetical protein
MQPPGEDDPARFQDINPRLREEVSRLLEHAFQREAGRIPDEMEIRQLETLAGEAERKAESAERLSEEALQAAVRASELYAATHALDDLEAVQRWEAEAASYRREAESYQLEAEHLRRYLPG